MIPLLLALALQAEPAPSLDRVPQSPLCQGEAAFKKENPWEPEQDVTLSFRAKSRVEALPSGRSSIVYDFVVYPKAPYDALIRDGSRYLIEWETIKSEKVVETQRLHESPLFFLINEAADAELQAAISRAKAAERRFMRIEGTHYFTSTIFLDKPQFLRDDAGARIVVYDRNLKERASFHCPAFVESSD
ncbi:MAG: hypothetical protein HYZ75_13140 [Elusimicrobia bacterium]|nr:hypothetical protein [Elusimicrobiota bacterium]